MKTNTNTQTLHRGWRAVVLIITIALLALTLLQVTIAAPRANPPYNHGRFGFGVTDDANGGPEAYDVASLNAGWYWDWTARGETDIPPLEYMQTVDLKPVKSGDEQIGYTASPTGTTLRNRVLAQPGGTWLIGNEPDCTAMNNMRSEWYARAYHDMYTQIKSVDPTAKVGAGSIVQPTPQRLMYLDRILDTYLQEYGEALPTDLWVTHSYILCEKCYPFKLPGEPFAWGSCWVPDWPSYGESYDIATAYTVEEHWDIEIFKARLIDMRQWMYDNGYRDHPLIITEYGVLFYEGLVAGKTDQDNIDFMYAGFDWMLNAIDPTLGYAWDNNRLIQKWAWYSLNHNDWYLGGSLFNVHSKQPTALGTAFANYTTENAVPTVDLRLQDFEMNASKHTSGSVFQFTTTFTLSNASDVTLEPITLTVYEDQASIVPIVEEQIDELRCCGDHEAVVLTWTEDTAEPGEICVQVSSPKTVAETECRNFGAGVRLDRVWVEPHITQTQPTTATVYAKVTNTGPLGTLKPVTVTFYMAGSQNMMLPSNTTSNMLIGQTIVPPLDCCHDTTTVTVTWPAYERGSEIMIVLDAGYVDPISNTVTVNSDLNIEQVWAPSVYTLVGVSPVARLRAQVVNEGVLATGSPVTVSFYLPGTSNIPIGETTIPELACCGDQAEATYLWESLPEDRNLIDFCAIASTPYDVTEPKCGQFLIAASQLYLPYVSRD